MAVPSISIHALLTESDRARAAEGRRPEISIHALGATAISLAEISIHALLAESDWVCTGQYQAHFPFLSTLSLRRATVSILISPAKLTFLSTLSLRRATVTIVPACGANVISIHALLAESDLDLIESSAGTVISIHALLAESDLPAAVHDCQHHIDFYPRSPCGERPVVAGLCGLAPIFLSTLSLRRATLRDCPVSSPRRYFYPRSPCGERHKLLSTITQTTQISIHALLAESDAETT